jgi:hypothetical protein
MSNKVIKINTHLPAIPDWLKVSKTISFTLPLKTAKELAARLAEVKGDVEIDINFASGKEVGVEVKYEDKEEE